MGTVYQSTLESSGQQSATRVMPWNFACQPELAARFMEGAESLADLSHPNLVRFHEVGCEDGVPYLVMETVLGNSLDWLLFSEAHLPLAENIKIMQEVCLALGYAHCNDVVHLAVKPTNIFVQPDGTAKLLDLGLAQLALFCEIAPAISTGRIGPILYCAPERLLGEPLGACTDVFEAGVVLYQLVAGRLPFDGPLSSRLQKVLHDAPPPLNTREGAFPPLLQQVVDCALAKAPADRYPTAQEMALDLEAVLAELAQTGS